ncbi:MAG: co-chaperone GroES [Pirellulaceae bacterium]|nr:co-chaperone GroES [Pirellulaceae bacterium]
MMQIIPLGNKVVIKRQAEKTSIGGILLPDSSQEKPNQGRVLSVGDGQLLKNGQRAQLQVKEGDRVIFSSYAGAEVSVDGQELLILSEDEILAVSE